MMQIFCMTQDETENVCKICKHVLFGYLQYISVEHRECKEHFEIPTCDEVINDDDIKMGVLHFIQSGGVTKMLLSLKDLCVKKDPRNCVRLLNKSIFKLWYMERHNQYKQK